MCYEPSTLRSLAGLLETALREEYGIDPVAIFTEAGVPIGVGGFMLSMNPLTPY